jgi:hypothetical protein
MLLCLAPQVALELVLTSTSDDVVLRSFESAVANLSGCVGVGSCQMLTESIQDSITALGGTGPRQRLISVRFDPAAHPTATSRCFA